MNRRVLAVAALVLLAGCTVNVSVDGGGTPPAGDGATTRTATVVEVVDGDTVDVRYANGSRETVRLLGVDTPEVHVEVAPDEYESVPDTDAGRACLEQWGERASGFARERLAGATVTVATDRQADRRGSYGRLLAYVTVQGTDESFNHALLQQGYARLYSSEFTRLAEYRALEDEAQRENRGLWGPCAS